MIEIYSKPGCPFCVNAKALLKQKGQTWTEYDLTQNPELRDEMLTRANGHHTVPQIFINHSHIGGCDELMALNDNGKLDTLLNEPMQ